MKPIKEIVTEYAIDCYANGFVKKDLQQMLEDQGYEIPLIKNIDDDGELIEEYHDVYNFIKNNI